MSLLQKILYDHKSEPEKKPQPVIEPVPTKEPEPLVADVDTVCGKCGHDVLWLPIGAIEHRCDRCQPAPAESLVRFRFFFFESVRWIIWTNDEGQEVWTKETEF
jgi:hypothetical protein